MTRAAMWALLAVVAGSAAVLSFAALRDLAVLCGFAPGLAWLLPVVIDAGAAAGCAAWLGAGHLDRTSCRFARALTVVLLASSVVGNAAVHYLTSARLTAPWWLTVVVSAVAPATLGAVTHLAVLVTQGRTTRPVVDADGLDEPTRYNQTPESDPVAELIESGAGRRRLARELSISEHEARRLLAERTNGARS